MQGGLMRDIDKLIKNKTIKITIDGELAIYLTLLKEYVREALGSDYDDPKYAIAIAAENFSKGYLVALDEVMIKPQREDGFQYVSLYGIKMHCNKAIATYEDLKAAFCYSGEELAQFIVKNVTGLTDSEFFKVVREDPNHKYHGMINRLHLVNFKLLQRILTKRKMFTALDQ